MFGSLLTTLLWLVGELAGGGSVAMADDNRKSDRWQVTCDRLHVSYVTKQKNLTQPLKKIYIYIFLYFLKNFNTSDHPQKNWDKKSIRKFFFGPQKKPRPLLELEEGPRSAPHLLVGIYSWLEYQRIDLLQIYWQNIREFLANRELFAEHCLK